mmetsp:Transcript_25597/g.70424  ORF Transcript_25597/g.70424 Transcript_25597/m.70424 type:complete len:687 (-) Transcript_25597:1827-3887(-)
MSHRAIQRLRREREAEILAAVDDGEDSDDESDEDDNAPAPKSSVFAAAMFDSDSDSDDDSGSDDDSDDDNSDADSDDQEPSAGRKTKPSTAVNNASEEQNSGDPEPDAEDLDALLEEFQLKDEERDEANGTNTDGEQEVPAHYYDVILAGMDVRDLDIESVRRSLFGGIDGGSSGPPASSGRRSHRQLHIFGTPGSDWPRPPHYVGGGIGMKSYADGNSNAAQKTLPWPYRDTKEGDPQCPPANHWFEFVYSDSYQRDCQDFATIRASGDPNALALFVAHHPFVVEGLLQLSIVMYQMNQSREGLAFLKRALWVLECAAPNSFLRVTERCALMDCRNPTNEPFFAALGRLVRVAYVGGLARTSLAASRFLLSLDPLRDPGNVLLAIDHFALMCNNEACNTWLVECVESETVHVAYRDEENEDEFNCQLLDLPNWAFSYALALFDLQESSTSEIYSKERADEALKSAFCRFPSVIGQFLEKNEVDVKGRSSRTDWPAAMECVDNLLTRFREGLSRGALANPVVRAHTSQAYDTIVRIFVQQNFKLWSSFAVVKWMYDNLMALRDAPSADDDLELAALSPAMMRYARADPADYEDKFQTMPADANPFDPNLVALAMNIDPNRGRLVQRHPRHAEMDLVDENGIAFAARENSFAGPPTEVIDPDLPLLEVFWRSALPWAHVEGVPPPAR